MAIGLDIVLVIQGLSSFFLVTHVALLCGLMAIT
jgi:hypothetical protein